MKRIFVLATVVVGLTLGGFATSSANAGYWGPGYVSYGHRYPNCGYNCVRTYPYQAGFRVYSPNVFFTAPSLGIGVGTGYGYPSPYPVYGYGYYGW